MYEKFMKRFFDFCLSFLALVLLSPIALMICIWIKCDSPGPVFLNKRVGRARNLFDIYKFRSMLETTPSDCPTHLLKDPQKYITRSGRFLRKTSLDELPQLINILLGHMSLSVLVLLCTIKMILLRKEKNMEFISIVRG